MVVGLYHKVMVMVMVMAGGCYLFCILKRNIYVVLLDTLTKKKKKKEE